MKVCKECGAVNGDGEKICRSCGRSLYIGAADRHCPACGAAMREGETECGACGGRISHDAETERRHDSAAESGAADKARDTEKAREADKSHDTDKAREERGNRELPAGLCGYCGYANASDETTCVQCGKALDGKLHDGAVLGGMRRAQTGPTSGAQGEKPVGKLESIVERAIAFDGGRHIVPNIAITVIAFALALMLLLSPVHVLVYCDYAGAGMSQGTVGEYVEVDQSIWKFFSVLGYMNGVSDDERERIVAEYDAAVGRARADAMLYSGVGDNGPAEYYKKCFAERLSDINYSVYLLAATDGQKHSGHGIHGIAGEYLAARIGAACGLIAALVAVAAATAAVVYFALALACIFGGGGGSDLFTFLPVMTSIVGSGLLVTAFAPLLGPGGAFRSAMSFLLSAYIVSAVLKSIVAGDDRKSVIMRAATAALAALAFSLLFTNISGIKSSEYGAPGMAESMPLSYMPYAAIIALGRGMAGMGAAISELLAYALGVATAVLAFLALKTVLRCCTDGSGRNRAALLMFIAGGLAALLIILTGVVTPIISGAFVAIVDDAAGAVIYMRTQTYFAAVMLIACGVLCRAGEPGAAKRA